MTTPEIGHHRREALRRLAERKDRTAAQLLRDIAAADPEAHDRALARGYGVGPEVAEKWTVTRRWYAVEADDPEAALLATHGVPGCDFANAVAQPPTNVEQYLSETFINQGERDVIMRRMEALKAAIDELPVNVFDEQLAAVQWHWDNVHRALTKAFGLPR